MSAKKPSFCHLCGQPLVGSFYTYSNNLVVCASCNATVPSCALCQVPSRKLTTIRSLQVCPDCRQKLPVCASCGIPIVKEYSIVGDSPLPYCHVCMEKNPRCDICRVPLNDRGFSVRGERSITYRCATCFNTAVKSPVEAQQLYRETRERLARELGLSIPALPDVRIVERSTLMTLNAHNGAGTAMPSGAEQQHLLGFFLLKDDQRTIFIEQLLPRPLFQAVAAHELAHAWQSYYAPSTQPLNIVEGFAEWVAYRLLLALGQQRDAAHMTRRDDLYGQGLQYFIALERQHGRDAVMQRAREA